MSADLFWRKTPRVQHRCLHLDLKGMPPTSPRLLQLPEILGILRINAVLVEWEDTYPWSRYPQLRGPTAYSERTVRTFIRDLAACQIEVIPLIQCLGHVENVLTKKRFVPLREHRDSAGEFCPMRPRCSELVIDLIKDVLRTHQGYIRRVHLGGDEPWTFGSCPKCKAFIRQHGKAGLYLRHINPILDYLNRRGLRGVFWDDQIREWPREILSALSTRAELHVWQYDAEDIFSGSFPALKRTHLDRYTDANIQWSGAPAFKLSWDGDLPNMGKRIANIKHWIQVLRDYPEHGMVATGWSRGDFCATAQCGLEPAWDIIVMTAALMWDGALPKDCGKIVSDYIRKGPLAGPIGKRFEVCRKASATLAQWNQQMRPSQLWNSLEEAASVSFEPERFNMLTLERFHGFAKLQEQIRHGMSLGKNFIAAHRGLVPDHWLRIYADARVRHHLRRFELLVERIPRRCDDRENG